MLKTLLSYLIGPPASTPVPLSTVPPTLRTSVRKELRQTPRYPPFDEGMPLEPVEDIIESQSELIDRLRAVCGFTADGFEKRMMSVIRNYVNYVHLLPASRDDNHKGAGGLLRMGLEVGFLSMQSAGGRVFGGRDSAEKRKLLQPRWVYGTFIAGLCCEIHRPITSMSIVNEKGDAWPQFMQPLYPWAVANDVDRYYIHWSDSKTSQQWYSTAAYVLNNIIPQECLQYLNEENAQIVASMTASITGAARHGDGNQLAEIVKQARDIVIEKDAKANPSFYGRYMVGAHLEPHLVDVMRELLRAGDWKINGKQARIWYTAEGMFIVWPPAFTDIQSMMQNRSVSGFPANQDTLAELLLDAGVVEPNRYGGACWDIILPGSAKLAPAVKLTDPRLLIGTDTIEFADVKLLPTEAPAKTAEPGESATSPKERAPVENAQAKEPAPAAARREQSRQTSANQQKDDEQADPEFFLKQMLEDTRRLITMIRDDYLAGESEHPVWMSAKGLMISAKELNSHGISTVKVIDDLRMKNWLVFEPGSSRLLVKTEKDGVKMDAYLINKQIAMLIGFKEL